MKRTYINPSIRVITVECGHLLQASAESPMKKGSGPADTRLDVLSNKRGIWDED